MNHETTLTTPAPAHLARAGSEVLLSWLAAFDPISLSEMKRVELLNRVDAKYVMPRGMLLRVVAELAEVYSVLEVEGQRFGHYRTLYFDTSDFAMYRRHHAGGLNRYKIRSREYVDSGSSFFEVKFKTNKKRTVKRRLETADLVTLLSNRATGFLAESCPYGADDLLPRLWTGYSRITLVHKTRKERVTLDFDMDFSWQGAHICLPGVVVAEVKQERGSRQSEFMCCMRQNHMRSTGFSKYCIGVSLLYPDVKKNNFKAEHRLLARMVQGA